MVQVVFNDVLHPIAEVRHSPWHFLLQKMHCLYRDDEVDVGVEYRNSFGSNFRRDLENWQARFPLSWLRCGKVFGVHSESVRKSHLVDAISEFCRQVAKWERLRKALKREDQVIDIASPRLWCEWYAVPERVAEVGSGDVIYVRDLRSAVVIPVRIEVVGEIRQTVVPEQSNHVILPPNEAAAFLQQI